MRHVLTVTVSLAALALAVSAHAAESPPVTTAPAPDVAGTSAANASNEVVVVANRAHSIFIPQWLNRQQQLTDLIAIVNIDGKDHPYPDQITWPGIA